MIIKRACLAFHVNQDEIKVIKRLLGGMSHLTYHIQIQDVDYTFRVIGEGGNLFVDRKTEKENLERIEPLGINNETVYFDVDTGEKAAKYVEGIVLKDTDIYPHLEKIAHVLKRLHDT
ncbi:MAG: phosphotransferase, partial [Acholeplasmataceae bacterium]|nr:phosphotransferase [Acholeplasmataceae bacterium]